jgi:hypothetical protein
MAPSFANMPAYARRAFIAAQLDRFADEAATNTTAPPSSFAEPEPTPDQLPNQPPKTPVAKKSKLTAANRAKACLRASKASAKTKLDPASARRSSPAAASLGEDDSESTFEHHRRKCQVCSHPDRQAIEELFIHWHSPRSICAEFGLRSPLEWSSIYRHARAVGLYDKRRKNLRAVFDLVLERASSVAPTAHGIVAVVRAYTCLTDTHQWVEPEKRVHIVNHVYRHDIPACPDGGRAEAGPARPDVGRDERNAPAAVAASSTTSAPEPSAEPAATDPLCQGTVSTVPPPTRDSGVSTPEANDSPSASFTSNIQSPTSSSSNRHTSELESPPTRT